MTRTKKINRRPPLQSLITPKFGIKKTKTLQMEKIKIWWTRRREETLRGQTVHWIPRQPNLTIHMFWNCLWIPQTVLDSANKVADFKIRLFLERFRAIQYFRFRLWKPKQQRRSKKSSNGADSNLILACCGILLQCTECTVWPRDGNFEKKTRKR